MKSHHHSNAFVRARRRKFLGVGMVLVVLFILLLTAVAMRRSSTNSSEPRGSTFGSISKGAHKSVQKHAGQQRDEDVISLQEVASIQRDDNNADGAAITIPPAEKDQRDVPRKATNESDEHQPHGAAFIGNNTPPPVLLPSSSGKKVPLAILHTDHGDITWELFEDDAPVTVANIVRMAHEGVFNKSCFYRYEQGFVLQGGLHCNKPPPHHGKAKNVPLEYKRRNEKYTVALARAGSDLNSGGTEFFINLRDNSNTLGPGKKGGYAVFAAVIDGLDTIAELKKLPTKKGGLTRFVSPQPVIEFIEIRNYDAVIVAHEDRKSKEPTLARRRRANAQNKGAADTQQNVSEDDGSSSTAGGATQKDGRQAHHPMKKKNPLKHVKHHQQ